MTKTEHFCDRCRNRIERGRSLIRVETGPLRDRLPMFDLCERCQQALSGWLDDDSGDVEVDGREKSA